MNAFHKIKLSKFFKAVCFYFASIGQCFALRLYLGFKMKRDYLCLRDGNNIFFGSISFTKICKNGVSEAINVDYELFSEILVRRGVLLFPEDSDLGYFANTRYLQYSVPASYAVHGSRGIVAFLAFCAMMHRDQGCIGRWRTCIPTRSKSDILRELSAWLSKHGYDKDFVSVFR